MSQSSFDSEFASVVRPEVLTTFGQTTIYTTFEGFARSITVARTSQGQARDDERGYRAQGKTLQTYCSTDDQAGISDPRENDRLEYDGLTWRFVRVVSQDGAGITIEWRAQTDLKNQR
jgi:hypothetical protein